MLQPSPIVRARHIIAFVLIGACVAARAPVPIDAQAKTVLSGVVASQPNAPAKLVSCAADVSGDRSRFTPDITFDPAATVKSSTVTYSFFDVTNKPVGAVQLSAPYADMSLPANTDNFTCSIAKEELADGTVFPAHGANTIGLVVGGLAGVGLIAALSGHGSSGASAPQATTLSTPTPTPTPSATASPTVSPSASPTVSPSASPTVSPTASPTVSPTASPTVSPTASPTVASAPMLVPNSVSINGTNNTATTVISETNYSGTFSLQSTTCASGGSAQSGQMANGPIATITPSSGIANNGTITVTAQEAGQCSITFKDATNQTVTLTISVTTTTITVNRKPTTPHPTPQPGNVPRQEGPARRQ